MSGDYGNRDCEFAARASRRMGSAELSRRIGDAQVDKR